MMETVIQQSKTKTVEEFTADFYKEHGKESVAMIQSIIGYILAHNKISADYFLKVRTALLHLD